LALLFLRPLKLADLSQMNAPWGLGRDPKEREKAWKEKGTAYFGDFIEK
jgi:hypothetical protein